MFYYLYNYLAWDFANPLEYVVAFPVTPKRVFGEAGTRTRGVRLPICPVSIVERLPVQPAPGWVRSIDAKPILLPIRGDAKTHIVTWQTYSTSDIKLSLLHICSLNAGYFNRLKLWVAVARHNFKGVKIIGAA